mmetsp:Transcript_10619/g.25973  ORF Transcript_10619/g.25973 Transcript_10619/m.25973 type:complete len:96 (-) Transcript_10619:4-291(-)
MDPAVAIAAGDTKALPPPAAGAAPRRKKKSRWGEGPAAAKPSMRLRKKCRWGPETERFVLPRSATYATQGMNSEQVDAFLFRLRLEQINAKLPVG